MPKSQMSNRQKLSPSSNITSITYWRKFAVHRVFYLGLAALFGLTAIAYFGSPGGLGGRNNAADRNSGAIAVVNGEPISRAVYENQWAQARQRQMQMRQFGQPALTPISEAQEQGRLLSELILNAIQTNLAKKRNLSVSDAEVEKTLSQYKQRGPNSKPMTDDELDKELKQSGASLAAFREDLKTALLPQVLRESIADKEKVTEADLLKTYDEIKARHIVFPVASSTNMMAGAKPDAQAKRDAEEVLAKLKAGADFAKTADLYSKDSSNQRTDLDPKTKKPVTHKFGGALNTFGDNWYKRGSGQSKEFEEVAFNLAKGQMSDLIKTPEGYQIVKVEDARRKLPDDYAKNKAELLKQEKMTRASKPFQDMIEAEKKAAKIEWKDPSLKWRYDFATQAMMPMMNPNGQGDKSQDAFLTELRDYTSKNKDDAAALLVLGQQLDRKMMMATPKPTSVKPGDREKWQNEAIAAYEQALQKTEDQQTRFRLADLYKQSGRKDDAAKQYEKIMRLLSYDDDPNSRFQYQQLNVGFQSVGKPDRAAEAMKKFTELTKKAEEERKKNEAARKASLEKEAKDKAAAAKAAADKAATDKTKPGAVKPAATKDAQGGTINVVPATDGSDTKPATTDTKPLAPSGSKKP